VFTRGAGPRPTYSFDLRIADVSTIPEFHFNEFEGPDSNAKGNLLTLQTINTPRPFNFSFCPTGGYVDSPNDGFSIGGYQNLAHDPLIDLIKSASNGHGELVVLLRDFKNPKIVLQTKVNLARSETQFHRFLSSK
jgi:hypothetical protein